MAPNSSALTFRYLQFRPKMTNLRCLDLNLTGFTSSLFQRSISLHHHPLFSIFIIVAIIITTTTMHQCQHYVHPQGFLKKSWQHFAAHLAAFLTFPLQFAGRMFHVFKVGPRNNRDHDQMVKDKQEGWWPRQNLCTGRPELASGEHPCPTSVDLHHSGNQVLYRLSDFS